MTYLATVRMHHLLETYNHYHLRARAGSAGAERLAYRVMKMMFKEMREEIYGCGQYDIQ